jgi:hypothetical protein
LIKIAKTGTARQNFLRPEIGIYQYVPTRIPHYPCVGGVAMDHSRALRYRKLALQEPDKEKAQLLQLLADEADRGVLCSVEWTRQSPKINTPIQSYEVRHE